MVLSVTDLQRERKALDTKLTDLRTQLSAVDTLILARGGECTAPTASLNTEPKMKRKYTRGSRRRSTLNFTRARLSLPNTMVEFAEVGIPEVMYRIHSELPPKFDLGTAATLVYGKIKAGLPASHGKKATISKLRNQIAGAIHNSTVPKALYALDNPNGIGTTSYGKNALYYKRFVPLDKLSAMLKG